MTNHLMLHVAKLSIANFHLDDTILKTNFEVLHYPEFYSNIQLQCEKEIEKMKNFKISNYTTLFDILFKSKNDMVMYAVNKTFIDELHSNDFEENYHFYKNLLKSQFRKGMVRKMLYNQAIESFLNMIQFNLPILIIDGIFQYLSNESLSKLAKANTDVLDKKVIEQRKMDYSSYDLRMKKRKVFEKWFEFQYDLTPLRKKLKLF